MEKVTSINFLIALVAGGTVYLMTKNIVWTGLIFFIIVGGGLSISRIKKENKS